MVDLDSSGLNIRDFLLDIIKERFESDPKWRDIEADIWIKLIEMPEFVTNDNKQIIGEKITEVKNIFIEGKFAKKDLGFLDDEIERLESIKQISLYHEQEDAVPEEIIERYAKLSFNTQGITGIHLPYNFKQLRNLTNGVFERTGLIKFYISREKKLSGKIVAKIYEYAQKIPIIRLVESRKIDKDNGEPLERKCLLFGERFDKTKYELVKEVPLPLYVYKFISENGEEFIVLSANPVNLGDYIVTGVTTQVDDLKQLTDSARLSTKLPYLFVHDIKNRIIQYKTKDELRDKLRQIDPSGNNLFDLPFTIRRKNGKKYLLKMFEWNKWLIWSWLLHKSRGLNSEYPLHILVFGPAASGKSTIQDSLHYWSKETKDVFSGTNSTMKNLVPSFKHSPPKLGYLAECNRFAYCDEFLRAIIRSSNGVEEVREEGIAMMNDLLEHMERESGSGNSSINVKMNARMYATTNPIRDVKTMEELLKVMDQSFLSRMLIYFQRDEDIQLVRSSNDEDLQEYLFDIDVNDFISIVDYCQSVESKFDAKKVDEIYEEAVPILSGDLLDHYRSRHKHHIRCLLDGIIKTRGVMNRDLSFVARDEDYVRLREVWTKVISSWINSKYVKQLPVNKRVHFMPEKAQYLFKKLQDFQRPATKEELHEACKDEISKRDLTENLIILINNEVMTDVGDGFIRNYYMTNNWKPGDEV